MKQKEYKIKETKSNGVKMRYISFSKNYKRLLYLEWKKDDKEAEKKAIRSADLCVIKNNLNYKTKTLKPLKAK